jgi:hypothetical protein
MFLNVGTGRGISHTLMFLLISFLIVHLLSKRNLIISFSFFIGTSFHIILDLPEVPLFFPFISYESFYVEDPLSEWYYTLLNDPLVLFTEILGSLILIFILVKNQLYSRKKIIFYLQNKEIEQK